MLRYSVIFLTTLLPVIGADVSLRGDGKLTGEITAMDEAGTITLVSPISEKPLLIGGDSVTRVNFGIPNKSVVLPDQRIHLVNGDVLPLVITSMENEIIHGSSPDLGNLDIPLKLVDSIQLGIVPEKLVWSGPTDFEGWIRDASGSRNWTIDDGKFLADGQGMISRDVKLPEKFVLKFNLTWSNYPNFRFSFADPLTGQNERSNRYFLEFNGAGINVKRESIGKNRFTSLIILPRSPEQFPGNTLAVEMRVDRARGRIHLYLNGVFEGRYTDPVPDIPTGFGISLLNQSPRESEQTIGKIRVLEWDDRGDRHRTEDRGDGKSDALIGRFGERFGGKLTSIRPGADGGVWLFKSDFQEDPIELPASEVSTLFIAGNTAGREQNNAEGLVLRLRGNGELRVTSCVFEENFVKVVHPLLGSMVLDRDGIALLERREILKAELVK